MKKICNEFIINPSANGVILKKQSFKDCYQIILDNDTTDLIKDISNIVYECHHALQLPAYNYSNLKEPWKEIWLQKEKLTEITCLFQNFDNYQFQYEKLKQSFNDLNEAISELNRILSMINFYSDKKPRMFNSGEYDVAHITYATICDKFYTEDKKLYHRTKAIYYYLGVPTEVILFNEKNLNNVL